MFGKRQTEGSAAAPSPIPSSSGRAEVGREAGAGVREGSPAVPAAGSERAWFALAGFMAGLIVLAVFILQNLRSVRVTFFWAHWNIPLGIDLLLATVLGGLVVFAAGSVRILKLRRTARSHPVRADVPPPAA